MSSNLRVRCLLLSAAGAMLLGSGAAVADPTITYEYDPLGRLESASNTGGVEDGKARDYTLDAAGNRTRVIADTASSANSNCKFSTGDLTLGDNLTASVKIKVIGTCDHPTTFSYTITHLSGDGSYSDLGWQGGSAVMGVNSVQKILQIQPVTGSVPAGEELVLQVRFATSTSGSELVLQSSTVTFIST